MYFKVSKIIPRGTISSIPCHEVLVCSKYSIFSYLTLFLFFFLISNFFFWNFPAYEKQVIYVVWYLWSYACH